MIANRTVESRVRIRDVPKLVIKCRCGDVRQHPVIGQDNGRPVYGLCPTGQVEIQPTNAFWDPKWSVRLAWWLLRRAYKKVFITVLED